MRKILFPTDFSETSNNAFLYALKLAENIEAEVITLHVYELPIIDMSYTDVPVYQAEVYESLELNNFENFKDQIPVLRRIAEQHNLQHIKISNVLLQGDLVTNVINMTKEQHIDYVVMGTEGATGLKEFFIGTATASVMTGTNALVLGIPSESNYEPIKKIGFTTQFTIEELDSLRKLLPLARGFDAEIECIYVRTSDNHVNEVIIADWKVIFKEEKVTFHIIDSNDVEDTIIEFINENNIHLLAMLNHKRSFWESLFHTSLTKKMAWHLKVPLLALHDN
ncbi:MAG: universal stress protein [Flavobacterium sp.]|nr:MAG: universal stress protein [Flavobacterium sp.]